MKRLFELKEEHIKLLRNANVMWNDCEFEAPAIDCKRPYGNSNVYRDIARLLGIKGIIIDGEEKFSQDQIDLMYKLHKETETALQIILVTGEFIPGDYIADEIKDNWKRRE